MDRGKMIPPDTNSETAVLSATPPAPSELASISDFLWIALNAMNSLPRLSALFTSLLLSFPAADGAVAWRRIDSSSQGVLPALARDVEPTATLALDVDGDRDADLIVGGRNSGPALTLRRYDGCRWTVEVIEPDDVRIEAGGAAHDIDGDGDPDIVFGGDSRSGEIWWWENPHPQPGRWQRRVLKRDGSMQSAFGHGLRLQRCVVEERCAGRQG